MATKPKGSSVNIEKPTAWEVGKLVERFAKAGWIKQSGWKSVAPFTFFIEWSELGRNRMTKIRAVLQRNAPSLFNESGRKPGILATIWIAWRVLCLTRTLRLPKKANGDEQAVMAIALICNQESDGQISPVYYSDLE